MNHLLEKIFVFLWMLLSTIQKIKIEQRFELIVFAPMNTLTVRLKSNVQQILRRFSFIWQKFVR